MKCPNCGNEIPDEAKFCQHCGYKIEPTNTANGSQLEPSSNAAEKKRAEQGE